MIKLSFVLNVLTLIMSIVIFATAKDSIWLVAGALMMIVASYLNIISTMRTKR